MGLRMHLVFTDLDGTLLDHETYSWEAARPALARLEALGVPWIFVTSKTRAEVEVLRREMGNRHPFIVENGGAAFAAGDLIFESGARYAELVGSLCRASAASGCRVRGFHEMTVAEVAERCGLSLPQAALAMQREYDEPFVVLDADGAAALETAIGGEGRRVTRGGRFWHILGDSDKARAVRAVADFFAAAHGPVHTVGMGDSLNDAGFLNVVDTPVLIRSAQSAELQLAVPRGILTERAGPAGWNDAVLALPFLT
jgi:mannosyl-3-phosphoglycerate phosphatase